MSINYRPDNDATAGDPWDTAFLSDRDVSGQVPINYVPHPGVFLTAACFENGTYEDNSFKECFSNLLASEFRRFVVDVYWDVLNRRFHLCPVEIPSQSGNSTAEASNPDSGLTARQTLSQNTTSTTSLAQNNSTSLTTTSTVIPPVPTTVSSSGTTLYDLGPYQCSASLGFDTVVSVLSDYIAQMSNTIEARLQFIIVNVHTASNISAPTSPGGPLSQSQLPISTELINNYLDQINVDIYTPVLLHNDRQNLNSSWFSRRTTDYLPLLNYFTVDRLPSGDLSTPDGWPNENYVQLQQGWSLLVGYGTVDSSINGYNFAGDSSIMFMPGYLTSDRVVQIDSSGNIVSGCEYSSTAYEVSQVNNSWAVSTVMNVEQSILGYAADNFSTCGISPVLNYTLNNQPASVDYEPYQNFGNQALFSWASGEPRNATEANQTSDNEIWSCALMVSNDEYKGHWRVYDCPRAYRAACREAGQPYLWQLSAHAVPYDAGPAACTGNTTFDVPRTGLENLYLYHQIQSMASTQDSSVLDGVWINFNSIDVEGCWVTTGPNGTCPYYQDQGSIHERTILVPTIAAFIALCITALTILVKCNANRRNSKMRRRGEGGWDYEGVPS